MPDRPEADLPGQPASYSPPPLPRPERYVAVDRQKASGTAPAGSTWRRSSTASSAAWPDGGMEPRVPDPSAAPRRRAGSARGFFVMTVVAALGASLGTYALLLAGGHLDRQIIIEPPLGQQV